MHNSVMHLMQKNFLHPTNTIPRSNSYAIATKNERQEVSGNTITETSMGKKILLNFIYKKFKKNIFLVKILCNQKFYYMYGVYKKYFF